MLRRIIVCVLAGGIGVTVGGCGGDDTQERPQPTPAAPTVIGTLWDPATPLPDRSDVPPLAEVTHVTVHRAVRGEYQFLSGPCIVAHKGRLLVVWTNGPVNEDQNTELLRGRWSADGGRTWGDVETIAGNQRFDPSYGHGTMLSEGGRLWAFPACFHHDAASVSRIRMEAFLLDEKTGKWEHRGVVAEDFWAHEEPKALPGGGWIVAGDEGTYPGHGPAVALIDANDPTRWRVVKIPPPPGSAEMYAAETTLWVDRHEVVAIIRNTKAPNALMSVGTDGGRSWTPAADSNLPMAWSRAYAGVLSTDQRYLISNLDRGWDRDILAVAVSRPHERYLGRVWTIRRGKSKPPLYPGKSKAPQWSYPWAIEHDGKLYVVYAVGKEDCGLSVIPVSALRVDSAEANAGR